MWSYIVRYTNVFSCIQYQEYGAELTPKHIHILGPKPFPKMRAWKNNDEYVIKGALHPEGFTRYETYEWSTSIGIPTYNAIQPNAALCSLMQRILTWPRQAYAHPWCGVVSETARTPLSL